MICLWQPVEHIVDNFVQLFVLANIVLHRFTLRLFCVALPSQQRKRHCELSVDAEERTHIG